MKIHSLPILCIAAFTISAAAPGLLAADPAPADSSAPASASATKLDFGDYASSTITSKAWKSLTEKDYDSVMGYTQKCIDMFKDKAVEMQKSLTAAPDTTQKEKVFANWALNDVGTCYFIQGKALEEQNKPKDALTAYQFLADNLGYAECWDTKGWFWSPAGAAKARVAALQFDSIK
jgi:hypothetical protein